MNQKELRELIEIISENRIAEFEMERAGFKLRIRTAHGQTATVAVPSHAIEAASVPPAVMAHPPVAAPPPTPPAPEPPATPQTQNLYTVKSPIVGTFYRAPSPTAKSFVEIGTRVQPGTVLCIIEAMKLMNEIESEVSGEVVEIYQENSKPVEYGQPIFGIKVD
ncbi:MAG: acetyl-CoA carboxylase biotin carboxyl carrier protein [Acidobacteria bacterium]|nr:acetyl-CoA carboxylase biotin carboxyl carrier protein [Acidobacteriota bacterium]